MSKQSSDDDSSFEMVMVLALEVLVQEIAVVRPRVLSLPIFVLSILGNGHSDVSNGPSLRHPRRRLLRPGRLHRRRLCSLYSIDSICPWHCPRGT